jgi:hypothetical protein
MKRILGSSLGLLTLVAGLQVAFAADDSTGGGVVDFGKFSPPASGGQFVEVNIRENLIAMAARLTEGQEPEIGKLLRGLKAVRVNVIGLDDANRQEIGQRIQAIRTQLAGAGWERVVTAQEKNEDVSVFIKLRGSEAIEGVAVTVLQGDREAVLVNVVGDIRPEQLATLGERFGIEPLKEIGITVKKS